MRKVSFILLISVLTAFIPTITGAAMECNTQNFNYGAIFHETGFFEDQKKEDSYQFDLDFYDNKKSIRENKNISELNYFPSFSSILEYDINDKGPFHLEVNYPIIVYRSLGIYEFSIGSVINFGNDYGMETIPYTSISLQYPRTAIKFKVKFPRKKEPWYSDDKKAGYYRELVITQHCVNGELSLLVNWISDPDKRDGVFPKIRGYRDALTVKEGEVYTLEYSQPFMEIDNGSRIGGVYLEDPCTFFFVDTAVPKEGEYQLSYGLGLSQELKVEVGIFSSSLKLEIGVGYNRENEQFVNVALDH